MPLLLVVVSWMVPRSALCRRTVTPGTTAPVWSATRPEMVAASVWEKPGTAAKVNSTIKVTARTARPVVAFAIGISPLSLVHAGGGWFANYFGILMLIYKSAVSGNPVRDDWGSPGRHTSAWRCEAANRAGRWGRR